MDVKKATEIEIAAGDRVTFLTAGGGGYGDPRERAPEAIAQDIGGGRRSPERPGLMIADERKKRLTDAMKDAGLDVLLVYGNAWQGDYLRYATDFGILEGQALAIVRERRPHHALSSTARWRPTAPRSTAPMSRCVLALDLVGEVDKAMNRMRNQRIGAAPQRLLPRRIAARAERPQHHRRDRASSTGC